MNVRGWDTLGKQNRGVGVPETMGCEVERKLGLLQHAGHRATHIGRIQWSPAFRHKQPGRLIRPAVFQPILFQGHEMASEYRREGL